MVTNKDKQAVNDMIELTLVELFKDNETEFTQRVASLIGDIAILTMEKAIKLEDTGFKVDTSNWAGTKDFICAMGRELERQYKRPIYTDSQQRSHNKDVKCIYEKI
jgi:hypothetical protein